MDIHHMSCVIVCFFVGQKKTLKNEHPWIDVKFNGENIEKCTFFGSLQMENVDGNGKRQH